MEITMNCGGQDVTVRVPDRNLMAVVTPKDVPPVEDVEAAIRKALENPIGSKRLSELVEPGNTVNILCSNYFRPGSHRQVLAPIIDELHKGGIKDNKIRFVLGNGVHRKARPEEIERLFGEFAKRYEVINYTRTGKYLFKGITPTYATPVWVNEEFGNPDITIGLGALGFNIIAGYSGGCKIISPGAVSYETINYNHRLSLSPHAIPGAAENPPRHDAEEMAALINFKFIINYVPNPEDEVAHVVAGDPKLAHREGIKVVWDNYHVALPEEVDILIVNANASQTKGAAPIADMLYAVIMTQEAVRQGGTMIYTHRSPWPEHPIVHRGCPWYKECERLFVMVRPDHDGVLQDLHQGRLPGWYGAAAYRVARAMAEKDVFIVNEYFKKEHLEGSGWQYGSSVDEVLEQALRKHGPEAKVVVVPYGGRFFHLDAGQ